MPALKHLPTTLLPRVFHVGTMDPSHKGRQGNSHEGNGLSVSMHPQEWTRIARLGGQPTWSLVKRGARFLAMHLLSDAQRAEITSWAVESGWLQLQSRWRLSYMDLESNRSCYQLLGTMEAAETELDFMQENLETKAKVDEITVPVATPRLADRLGFVPPAANGVDLAATIYAEDIAGLDGVWWEDELDVAALSAPRGVINLKSLSSWTCRLQEEAPRPRMRRGR